MEDYVFVLKPDEEVKYMTLSAYETPNRYTKFVMPAIKIGYFLLFS